MKASQIKPRLNWMLVEAREESTYRGIITPGDLNTGHIFHVLSCGQTRDVSGALCKGDYALGDLVLVAPNTPCIIVRTEEHDLGKCMLMRQSDVAANIIPPTSELQ